MYSCSLTNPADHASKWWTWISPIQVTKFSLQFTKSQLSSLRQAGNWFLKYEYIYIYIYIYAWMHPRYCNPVIQRLWTSHWLRSYCSLTCLKWWTRFHLPPIQKLSSGFEQNLMDLFMSPHGWPPKLQSIVQTVLQKLHFFFQVVRS